MPKRYSKNKKPNAKNKNKQSKHQAAYSDTPVNLNGFNQSKKDGTSDPDRQKVKDYVDFVHSVVKKLNYGNSVFSIVNVSTYFPLKLSLLIRTTVKTIDRQNFQRAAPLTHHTRIEKFYTEHELLHEIWKGIKELEDHERDEMFQYDGQIIFDPHEPWVHQLVA